MTHAWEKSVRRIAIASDHGGFEYKDKIKTHLKSQGIEAIDLGVESKDSADYPDYAIKVATLVSKGKVPEGILVCGTGIGMSMTANKFPGVRAAVVTNTFTAKMSRAHNNANILCLGQRVIPEENLIEIIDTWLAEDFEGGRHNQRVEKMIELDHFIVPPAETKEETNQ